MKRLLRGFTAVMLAAVSTLGMVTEAHADWEAKDGKQYYYAKNGSPATGPTLIDGVYYNFGSDGECKGKFTGMIKKSAFWRKGKLVKNKYITLSDGRRFFAEVNGYLTPVKPDAEALPKSYSITSPEIIVNGKSLTLFSLHPFGFLQKKGGKYFRVDTGEKSGYSFLISKKYLLGTVKNSEKPKNELETRYIDSVRDFEGCKVYSNGELTVLVKDYSPGLDEALEEICFAGIEDPSNIDRSSIKFVYLIYDTEKEDYIDLLYKYNKPAGV